MKVWVATWEIGVAEAGFELFAEEALAIDAAIGYAQEMSLLGDEHLTVSEARRVLQVAGEINFYDRQCAYAVRAHDVIGCSAVAT